MSDVAIFGYSLANVLFEKCILLGELRRKACKEFAHMTTVLLISEKEEACFETVSFMISTGHCARNSVLACSSYHVQSKYVYVFGLISLSLDLLRSLQISCPLACS